MRRAAETGAAIVGAALGLRFLSQRHQDATCAAPAAFSSLGAHTSCLRHSARFPSAHGAAQLERTTRRDWCKQSRTRPPCTQIAPRVGGGGLRAARARAETFGLARQGLERRCSLGSYSGHLYPGGLDFDRALGVVYPFSEQAIAGAARDEGRA